MIAVSSWIVFVSALLSAHICCRSLLRGHNRTIVLLSLIVLWMTLVIVPVQFLGTLEIMGVISRVTVPKTALVELIILSGIVVLAFVTRLPAASSSNTAVEIHKRLPFYLVLSAAVIGGSYLLFAIELCTSFPKGFDALSYHLPLALRWLQEESLRFPVNSAWQFTLPGNCEIAAMLALATGRQYLASLVNCVSSLVLAIAAYPLALRFSKGEKAAAFAAVLVVFTIPMVQFQTFSVYADLFGTAFFVAAVTLFAHCYHSQILCETMPVQRSSLAVLAASALACGLSLGTKTTFVPYCALFFGIVVYVLWKERSIHNKPVSVLLSLFLAGILLPSAFWYGRAQYATGNLLYPMQVSVGTHVIFPGYQLVTKHVVDEPPGGASNHGDRKFVRHASEWFIYPWTEWLNGFGYFPTVYGPSSGLGGAFAAFVVVGIGFAAYQCAGGLESQDVARMTRTFLLAWLVCLLIWIFAMHRLLRYGLPIWVFACLLAAPAMGLLMKIYPRSWAVLFVCAISTTCAISSLTPFHDLAGNLLSRRWSRSASYGYPALIDELPPDTVILSDTRLIELHFYLAGNRLTNKVVTAFDAPQEITPEFISSHNIEYIVQVTPTDAMEDDSSPWGLPEPVHATEVFHSTQAGKYWRIWKVRRTPMELRGERGGTP